MRDRSLTARHGGALVVCLAALLLTAPALAQGDDSRARAQKLYEEGAQLIIKGDHAAAIYKLKQGYNLDPNGMFLYTMSVAYGRMGKIDEALQHAERALADKNLPASVRNKITARRGAFTVVLDARRAAVALEAHAKKKASQPEPVVVKPAPRSRVMSGIGMGLTIVGAGLLTGALIANLQVNSALNDDGTVKETSGKTAAEVQDIQSTGQILLVTGGGALATGVILLVIDAASAPKARPSAVRPVLQTGPGQVGLGVHARF